MYSTRGPVQWLLRVGLFLIAVGVVSAAGGEYIPPPEAQGGWRALVRPNQAATADEQRAVREKAGLDWPKLKEAQDYCASFGVPNHLLVIRHGWLAAEWHNFAEPRGIASCTKSLTALAMARLFDLSDAGYRDFARRLRIYDIGDQDRIVERIWREFPGLYYILGAPPLTSYRRVVVKAQ
ncbi:MAG: hypothetical protein FJ290_01510 [Planctomycetes bacterium]|nr:hypothetical protein [Planctomycetota bacterium]